MAGNLTLVIEGALLARMFDLCRAAYPEEACGAMLGRDEAAGRVVTEIVAMANVAESRANRFETKPRQMLDLLRRERESGVAVVGFFHSHPDHPALPSETDRGAAWPQYSYPIISVVSGEVSCWNSWRLRDDGSGYDAEVVRIVERSK